MALTNIELYEALRKDLSEDSARMIAEVVPPASDLVTRADFAVLETKFADLRTEFADLRWVVEERLARTDRRIGAYGLALLVPVWSATVAALFGFVLEI